MNKHITALNDMGVDTSNTIRAVQTVRALIDASDDRKAKAETIILNLTGEVYDGAAMMQSRLVAMAITEAIVKVYPINFDEIHARVAGIVTADPWMLAGREAATTTEVNAEGETVVVEVERKKGRKGRAVFELLEQNKTLSSVEMVRLLEKTMGISTASARTQVYNFRKANAVAGAPVVAKVSKAVQAKAIYEANKTLNKDELIAVFMAKLGTSLAGANTYFYQVIKG